jgi:anti-anti-sigma regulatory factor
MDREGTVDSLAANPARPVAAVGGPLEAIGLSVFLPSGTEADARGARLSVEGAIDRDVLEALSWLALVVLRRGYRELVLDLSGLTDFPTSLFAELRTLGRAAREHTCHIRLVGLDKAVAAVCRQVERSDL